MRIEYIEGYPAVGNPLQKSVFPIAEMALTFYGFLINAEHKQIINPLPALVPYYVSQGYALKDKGSGCPDLTMKLGDADEEFGAEVTAPADGAAELPVRAGEQALPAG